MLELLRGRTGNQDSPSSRQAGRETVTPPLTLRSVTSFSSSSSVEPAAEAQELSCFVFLPRRHQTAGVKAKPCSAMADNAGLENHRIKSFKNKGRDVEVSSHKKTITNNKNYRILMLKKIAFGPHLAPAETAFRTGS